MKSNKLVLVLLVLTSIILACLYFNAGQKCKSCEQEEQSIKVLSEKHDFSLKIDCTKNKVYQPFQYDIANGYSIMGKLELDSDNSTIIKKIEFEIYEAGNCKRYKLDSVTHENYQGNHLFEFQIEPIGNDGNTSIQLKKDISFKTSQIIFAKISSKDLSHIVTNFPPKSFGYSPEQLEGIVRHFPPFICPAQIYDGSAN